MEVSLERLDRGAANAPSGDSGGGTHPRVALTVHAPVAEVEVRPLGRSPYPFSLSVTSTAHCTWRSTTCLAMVARNRFPLSTASYQAFRPATREPIDCRSGGIEAGVGDIIVVLEAIGFSCRMPGHVDSW